MPETAPQVTTHPWRHVGLWAAVALVLGAIAATMFATHRAGHWWGDDWALYVNQARSLVRGNPGDVTADNLFTVEESLGPAFSPPLYPWGFPIMLAPFVLFVGRDVDQLTVVPVLCAVVFSLAWFLLARRRFGALPALIGVVAVTLTPLLVSWSELIQSEWPFLATAAVVLLGLDRLAADGTLVDLGRPLWPLVVVGLGATAAFSVRREGLAVVGAIAAAQLAALIAADRDWWRDRDARARMALRLITPHTAALASVLALQAALPSTLVPRYSGTSVGNVWRFRRDHVEHVAEVAGFKSQFADAPEAFGSEAVGWTIVGAYYALALAGIVLAMFVHRRRDLHLVAYVVGALLIGGSFRSPINRYVVTVAPILTLLAVGATVAVARRIPWRFAPTVLASVVLGTIATANVVRAVDAIDHARAFAEADAVEWGSTHPAALEMYGYVLEHTEPDDVVAAPKARAMTMITERRAVQVDDVRPIPDALDLRLVVVEPGTALDARLRAAPGRYRVEWSNSRFVLFEPISSGS